ncbi:hypothetical protein R3379_35345 [Bacillus sp. BAU-SS-2023]|nr:hypothetical protein [Bacillus sp. BAU-SS-2023]
MTYINAKSKYLINVKNIKVKHKFDTLVTKSVNITEDQIEECKKYAEKYIEEYNDYKVLVPASVKDEKMQKEIAKQIVFADKIGECAVLNYFKYRGLKPDILKSNKIGIKTYIDKDIHNRLIIDKKEIESKNKNQYYIGAHLNLAVEDKKHPIKKYLVKNIYDIKRVQLYGYLETKFIESLRYEVVNKKDGKKEYKFYTKKASNYEKKDKYANFGFDCKWYYLDRVMDIEGLVMKIKK